MARVYRGLDRRLRRQVAVKVLASPFDRDEAFIERFRREARAAAGLSHPNVVAVFDSGSDDGTHFIVTELVEGETLADRIGRDGALPSHEGVAIGAAVARALAAAHGRGVVHRDVKPGNVMLVGDGGVKVVDFGIARATSSDTIMQTGPLMGTMAYLSPEQVSGERGDERSDIYALGCLLYEMSTGQPPFRADRPVATMYQHVNDVPAPPSTLAAIPGELEAITLRALEKQPKKRFGSAVELEQALLAVADASDTMPLAPMNAAGDDTVPIAAAGASAELPAPRAATDTRPITPAPSGSTKAVHRPPRRHRISRGWVIAAVLVLVVLAAAAFAFWLDPPDPRRVARQAARQATASVLPPTTDPTFATAWSGFMNAIASAQANDGLSGDVAEKLGQHGAALLKAYDDRDAEDIAHELEELDKTLAQGVDKGEISPAAFTAIDGAMFDLATALEREGALPVEPTEASTGPTDEADGADGTDGTDGKHGEPPYGEANGHEND